MTFRPKIPADLSVQSPITKLVFELGLYKVKDKTGFKKWVIKKPVLA
jgi:hypothetical protein